MVLALIVTGAALLAAAGAILWHHRQPAEPEIHHFRCPACGQKLRYAASKAGRAAICPRCRRPGTLPATPQPLAAPHFHGHPQRAVRRQSA